MATRLIEAAPGSGVDSVALVQLLRDRADRDGRSVALRVKRLGLWQEVSWAEQGRRVRDLAVGLAELGVDAGDAVGLMAEATPESLALDLACQSLGAATLPISPSSSAADVQYLLDLGEVGVLVIGDLETADRLRTAPEVVGALVRTAVLVEGSAIRPVRDWRLLTFEDLQTLGRESSRGDTLAELAGIRSPDEPMSLHPTAGTAGHPRLASISSANLIAAWSEFLGRCGPSPSDSFVVEAPLSHVAGRAALLLLPLLFGAIAHFPEHPDAVDEAMAEVSPTLSIALPQRWEVRASDLEARVRESGPINRWAYKRSIRGQRAMERRSRGSNVKSWTRTATAAGRWLVLHPILGKLGLRRIRAAAIGGRYVPPDLLDFWRAVGVPLVEFYGTTEASGLIAFQPEPGPAAGSGLRPPSNTVVRIGKRGEIETRGPGITPARVDGQHGEADGRRWFATGDCGELTGDTLSLSHRLGDLITVDGREVPIGDVERALRSRGYMRHVAVVGRDRPYLAALIELDLASVAAWARASSVRYGSLGSLATNPKVIELIRDAVAAANADLAQRRLPPVEKFAVLTATESFENNDVLALTGEVRRGEVQSRYLAKLESLYRDDEHAAAHPPTEANA